MAGNSTVSNQYMIGDYMVPGNVVPVGGLNLSSNGYKSVSNVT